jgi:hypothetical protein
MIRGNHEDEEVNYDFGFEQVNCAPNQTLT